MSINRINIFLSRRLQDRYSIDNGIYTRGDEKFKFLVNSGKSTYDPNNSQFLRDIEKNSRQDISSIPLFDYDGKHFFKREREFIKLTELEMIAERFGNELIYFANNDELMVVNFDGTTERNLRVIRPPVEHYKNFGLSSYSQRNLLLGRLISYSPERKETVIQCQGLPIVEPKDQRGLALYQSLSDGNLDIDDLTTEEIVLASSHIK